MVTLFSRGDKEFYILTISYMWYTLIGALLTILIGSLVSIFTCPQDAGQLDPKLVFPFLRRWVGRGRYTFIDLNFLTQYQIIIIYLTIRCISHQEEKENIEKTNKKLLKFQNSSNQDKV